MHVETARSEIGKQYDNDIRKQRLWNQRTRSAIIDAGYGDGTRGDAWVRTLGAKVSDEFFNECVSVQKLLGIPSRSEYARQAFRLYNGAILQAVGQVALTDMVGPEPKGGEPPNAGRTNSFELSRSDAVAKEGES